MALTGDGCFQSQRDCSGKLLWPVIDSIQEPYTARQELNTQTQQGLRGLSWFQLVCAVAVLLWLGIGCEA